MFVKRTWPRYEFFTTPFFTVKLCKSHVLCAKYVHFLNAHQLLRYHTSDQNNNFANKGRRTYVVLQYLVLVKNISKLKKLTVLTFYLTNQTSCWQENTCTEDYVMASPNARSSKKMFVKRTMVQNGLNSSYSRFFLSINKWRSLTPVC